MTQPSASAYQGRTTQTTAGASRLSTKGDDVRHLPLCSSRSSIYRTARRPIRRSRQRVQDESMTNDCRQTSGRDASDTGSSHSQIFDLVQFGRRFGRFGRVWSTSTKSKSPYGKPVGFNLVDLVDIHTGGTCVCGRAGRVCARTPAQDPFPPSVKFDQIDQIQFYPDAVRRFSFGRREPNRPNADQIPTKSRPNPAGRVWSRGRSR